MESQPNFGFQAEVHFRYGTYLRSTFVHVSMNLNSGQDARACMYNNGQGQRTLDTSRRAHAPVCTLSFSLNILVKSCANQVAGARK